jgi:hypothetical protein
MKIEIKPLSRAARVIGWLVSQTFNRLLAGTAFFESPQETHAWTYRELSKHEAKALDLAKMVFHPGDPSQCDSHYCGLPMCHAPALGGWNKYYVLHPTKDVDYYIGWKVGGRAYISRIPLDYPVRMLAGNNDTHWFAVSGSRQVGLSNFCQGTIGQGGYFSRLRLL